MVYYYLIKNGNKYLLTVLDVTNCANCVKKESIEGKSCFSSIDGWPSWCLIKLSYIFCINSWTFSMTVSGSCTGCSMLFDPNC